MGLSVHRGAAQQGCGAAGGSAATHLKQRVLAVPAEAVALPIKGAVVAVAVHRAGGRAGLVCALPHPALTGAGQGRQASGPNLPPGGPAACLGGGRTCRPGCTSRCREPSPRWGPSPSAYQVLQPTRMTWPGL